MAVVSAHVGPFFGCRLLTGQLAVQCFYIISGFYMGLVMSRKYGRHSFLFLFNRAARLYPVYLVVLALSLFVRTHDVGLNHEWIPHWGTMTATTRLSVILLNLLIEGKDLVCFLALRIPTGGLYWTDRPAPGTVAGYDLLLIPQTWSLGLEFSFYLLAPILVRWSTRSLIFLMLASLGTRIALCAYGFNEDPWTYRFFPNELALFLAGVLAFRAYSEWERLPEPWPRWSRASVGFLCVVLLLQGYLVGPSVTWASVLALALMPLGLPWLFARTKDNALGRAIGELSYPVYTSHLLVIHVLHEHVWRAHREAWVWEPITAAVVTVAFSAFLSMTLEKTCDRWRLALSRRWGLTGAPAVTLHR